MRSERLGAIAAQTLSRLRRLVMTLSAPNRYGRHLHSMSLWNCRHRDHLCLSLNMRFCVDSFGRTSQPELCMCTLQKGYPRAAHQRHTLDHSYPGYMACRCACAAQRAVTFCGHCMRPSAQRCARFVDNICAVSILISLLPQLDAIAAKHRTDANLLRLVPLCV